MSPRAALSCLILLPLTSVAHEDAVVSVPYDELWRRTNQALVIMGFTITARDKDAGIISAEIAEGAQPDWFTGCPKGRGIPESYGYSVSILLNVLDPESTGVRVAAQGFNTWYQNDHYGLFKTRRVRNTVRCTGSGSSNGEAEKIVLSHITGSSS